MTLQRIFANAGAQSTCASPITAVQTTVTLASASGFPSPAAGQQLSVVILDSGHPSFSSSNPLATNYEYQPVTSISGNVLTFGAGVRASFAGTTPKAYQAGATVAAVWLADDVAVAFPTKLADTSAVSFPTAGINFASIPQTFRSLRLEGSVQVTSAGTAADIYLQFSGDNAANYSFWQTYGDGSVSGNAQFGAPSAGTAFPAFAKVPGAGLGGAFFGNFELRIQEYTSTVKYKLYLATSAYGSAGAAGGLVHRAGFWNNSAVAVTSIFLGPPGGANFAAGSYVSLWGIP
jgi:hypothetical protein